MNQQYRELVEEIIEKKKKLALADSLSLLAKREAMRAGACADLNREGLLQSEAKLAVLESDLLISEAKAHA